MGDIADWLTEDWDAEDDWREWDADDDALIDEPIMWVDHTGKKWRLSQMESSHLVNILRLVVNRWATSLGVRPVPIKNPQAIINPNFPDSTLAIVSQRMAEELLRRLDKGEQLSSGYAVVWQRVVNKIQECLRRSQQPLNQKLLAAPQKLLCEG